MARTPVPGVACAADEPLAVRPVAGESDVLGRELGAVVQRDALPQTERPGLLVLADRPRLGEGRWPLAVLAGIPGSGSLEVVVGADPVRPARPVPPPAERSPRAKRTGRAGASIRAPRAIRPSRW